MSRKRKPTITQTIMNQVKENLKDIKYDKTKKQYERHAKKFVDYCRSNFNSKTYEECQDHVQDYVDYLIQQYTPSSVHTFAVAVSQGFKVPLESINKPKRKISEYTRGRDVDPLKVTAAKKDLFDPRWSYLVEFQKRAGIRRNDLKNLCGRNLKYDENNNLCLELEKSKGKKYQLQRILPLDEEFIKSYFEGVGQDEKVFKKELFSNNLNLHYYRAQHARECYFYYLKLARTDPQIRAKMEKEIRERWAKYNIDKRTGKPKKFNEKLIEGNYHLRGDVKKLAISKGMPCKFDKLVCLYISVFFLSHWRLGVCVHSYLLA